MAREIPCDPGSNPGGAILFKMKLCKYLIARKVTQTLFNRGTIDNVERIAFNSFLGLHYRGFGESETVYQLQRIGERALRKPFNRTDEETASAYLAGDFNFRAEIRRKSWDYIIPLIEKEFP